MYVVQMVFVLLLIFLLSICQCRTISTREICSNDTIDFSTKFNDSSIVVYGKVTGKTLNFGSDSTFHVAFRVDCILKGPITSRFINITEAGQVDDRKFCQEFPVGHGHSIAFLQRKSSFENDTSIFIPEDFLEVPYEKQISEILLSTCHLNPISPLESTENLCPTVSTDPHCSINTTTTKTTIFLPGNSVDSLDEIRSKSGSVQIDVDMKNEINSIETNLFLISMLVFVLQWN